MISGFFEIWFVLRILGHPIEIKSALIMESLTQAVRHLAFVVPAGIGVQEAGLIAFGQALGVSSDLALTVSLAQRIREGICGVPCLVWPAPHENSRDRRDPVAKGGGSASRASCCKKNTR